MNTEEIIQFAGSIGFFADALIIAYAKKGLVITGQDAINQSFEAIVKGVLAKKADAMSPLDMVNFDE